MIKPSWQALILSHSFENHCLNPMIQIRKERPEDFAAIRVVIERAFASADEALLVDRLRKAGKATLSLVATEDDTVIGHILFSPVTIESGDRVSSRNADAGARKGLGLAPLAVLPEFQNRGVGSLLVNVGVEDCRKSGYDYVVVLGHPHYYPRFGFAPTVRFNLKSEFDVADEVFMVMELSEGALQSQSGVVKYQIEFNEF
jgi:putative acetyltransferase